MLRSLTLAVSAIALAACATPPATTGSGYEARIIRDAFGVPHIYGERNADVAFGLAYAHSEDDWKNIEEVIRSSRGTLAEIVGESGAKSDDFVVALGAAEIVYRDYDKKVSPTAKALAEGYAAGLNTWCAEHPETTCARTMPVTGKDIVSGFVTRPMSFYGLDGEIDALISGRANMEMSTKTSTRASLTDTTDDIELGSNALAVAPSRSADGHTRLAVNSHQPYEGRVAWYEAGLKSEGGMDMIGGMFPGTPAAAAGRRPQPRLGAHGQQAGPVRYIQAYRRRRRLSHEVPHGRRVEGPDAQADQLQGSEGWRAG